MPSFSGPGATGSVVCRVAQACVLASTCLMAAAASPSWELPGRFLADSVLPSHAALRARIPNRSSQDEMLIATKDSGSFSFFVGNNSISPGFVTRDGGPLKFSGYSWKLFER